MRWYLKKKQKEKTIEGKERCQALSWLSESWVLPLHVVLALWDRWNAPPSCSGEDLHAAGVFTPGLTGSQGSPTRECCLARAGLPRADPHQSWVWLLGLWLEVKTWF